LKPDALENSAQLGREPRPMGQVARNSQRYSLSTYENMDAMT
jgi:hypothetical protein